MRFGLFFIAYLLGYFWGYKHGAAVFPYYANECIELSGTTTAKDLYHCMLEKKNQ